MSARSAASTVSDDPTARFGPGDWAILGLLCEADSHGFAIARAVEPGGALGRIWTVRQASVYRTLDILVQRGLATAVGEEPGQRGPNRTLFSATAPGRAAVDEWLQEPVEHFRDARSSLLLKVELLRRSDRDAAPLLAAQRARLEVLAAELEGPAPASGDPLVRIWRSEAVQAGIRAIDRMLAAPR